MKMTGVHPLYVAVPLWMGFGSVEAFGEPQVCYILDAVLFLYGIVLTALYCRLKCTHSLQMSSQTGSAKPAVKAEEGIYTGLTPHVADTYETIGQKKGVK